MKKNTKAGKPVVIKANNMVEKQNILNEMQSTHMTLQEVRFLAIYLSRINARDQSTRVVKFPLSDFKAILEVQKVNIADLKETTNKLLSKVVNVPDDHGGYVGFQLFKECKVYLDKKDRQWYIEIDAHDRALPLMFDFKQRYFTYKVDNVLHLLSTNQIRMYEILKQHEYKGSLLINIDELKKHIGVEENQYANSGDFKIKVLDSCKNAMEEKTDIRFEYELIKRGRGGKVAEISFIISANQKEIPPLSVEDFVHKKKERYMPEGNVDYTPDDYAAEERGGIDYEFLADAMNNEFDIAEVRYLYDLAIRVIYPEGSVIAFTLLIYDYLKLKYDLLNTKKNVNNRYGYLKKLIELDIV